MKHINYLYLSLIGAILCLFAGCNDEETNLSRAVLASVDVLEYATLPDGPQIITVTSDADWVAENPEWITVTPSSGHAGQTEVEIRVDDNLRENAADNPRKANVLFKGRNLESIATVVIRQAGDKFRDPIDYSIDDVIAAEDETVVRLPGMIVVAKTGTGFMATDGQEFMYVKDAVIPVNVGDKVSVIGEKHTDTMKMAYVLGERISVDGTATVPTFSPVDISSTLDATSASDYQYVSVSGDYNGTAITVKDMISKVYLIDPASELGVETLSGHKIKVTGYLAGSATPVVNIIPAEIEDLGLNEIVFYQDDFEWLDPWAACLPVHDYVATEVSESRQIGTDKVNGVSTYQEALDRGYDFAVVNAPGVAARTPDKQVYLQRNYFKFGLTGLQAGLVLPKFEVPENTPFEILFDWAPMKGSGGFDSVNLVIVVENDGREVQKTVPPHTLSSDDHCAWMHAQIELTGLKVDNNTKITIRPSDDQWPHAEAKRYFLDNIKVRQILNAD